MQVSRQKCICLRRADKPTGGGGHACGKGGRAFGKGERAFGKGGQAYCLRSQQLAGQDVVKVPQADGYSPPGRPRSRNGPHREASDPPSSDPRCSSARGSRTATGAGLLREKQDRRQHRGDYRHEHRTGGLNRIADFVVREVHGGISFQMCVRDSKSLVNLRASPLGAILSASNPRFCQGDDTSHTADAKRCRGRFSAPSCRAAHCAKVTFVGRAAAIRFKWPPAAPPDEPFAAPPRAHPGRFGIAPDA